MERAAAGGGSQRSQGPERHDSSVHGGFAWGPGQYGRAADQGRAQAGEYPGQYPRREGDLGDERGVGDRFAAGELNDELLPDGEFAVLARHGEENVVVGDLADA